MSWRLQQDSNQRLSRTGLLDMSEFFIKDKDKDRYTKARSKIEIKQTQKQDSNLRLSRTGLLDMSEFNIIDKDKDRYTKATTKTENKQR